VIYGCDFTPEGRTLDGWNERELAHPYNGLSSRPAPAYPQAPVPSITSFAETRSRWRATNSRDPAGERRLRWRGNRRKRVYGAGGKWLQATASRRRWPTTRSSLSPTRRRAQRPRWPPFSSGNGRRPRSEEEISALSVPIHRVPLLLVDSAWNSTRRFHG